MSWVISYFNESVQQTILVWPSKLQARYIRLTDLMVDHGPDLGMPHTKAMGKGLFEIRLKSESGLGRVFYCTLSGKRIIILHSFIKKTQKTPKKDLDLAYDRLKQVTKNAQP